MRLPRLPPGSFGCTKEGRREKDARPFSRKQNVRIHVRLGSLPNQPLQLRNGNHHLMRRAYDIAFSTTRAAGTHTLWFMLTQPLQPLATALHLQIVTEIGTLLAWTAHCLRIPWIMQPSMRHRIERAISAENPRRHQWHPVTVPPPILPVNMSGEKIPNVTAWTHRLHPKFAPPICTCTREGKSTLKPEPSQIRGRVCLGAHWA
jgi:hypothetical protein